MQIVLQNVSTTSSAFNEFELLSINSNNIKKIEEEKKSSSSPSSSHVCYSCSLKIHIQHTFQLNSYSTPKVVCVCVCVYGVDSFIFTFGWRQSVKGGGNLEPKDTNGYWKFVCMEILKRKMTGMSNWRSWSEKCLKTWFYVLARQNRAFCHSSKYLNHKSIFQLRFLLDVRAYTKYEI